MKYIKTCDIFNVEDMNTNIEFFTYCTRIARELEILDTFGVDENSFYPKINLYGKKSSMVLYYFKTMFKTKNKIDGFVRLIDIILT